MSTRKKMRVVVELHGDRPSRHVVPIIPTLSIADLIAEVSKRQKFSPEVASRIRLTLADSSILSDDDTIEDVIEPGETIHLRFQEIPPIPSTSTDPQGTESGTLVGDDDASDSEPEAGFTTPKGDLNSKRVKVALITPELARNGGWNEGFKIMAFGGSSISVDLTLDVVRREAARVLGWLDKGDISFGVGEQAVSNGPIHGSCACTVANQVFSSGHFEQLHCPKEIDGSKCGDKSCKYSHIKIASGILGRSPSELECKICTELFGFPCSKCLEKIADGEPADGEAGMRCPLVQNAGCKHIFHAHCYFSQTSLVQTCPAGCPAWTTGVEAIPFESQKPHLFVVHSGSIVDKVLLPSSVRANLDGRFTLGDSEVVDILQKEYEHLGPGLTVRLFSRKNTGLVSFCHSTIVSICCASRHAAFDGIVRFPLNGPLLDPPKSRGLVDFHTSSSPIFNEDLSATINSLGLDHGIPDGGEITLYVVKRKEAPKDVLPKLVGKSAVYTTRDDWHPSIRQTDRGMAAFLSSLLVFANYLALAGKDTENKRNMQNRTLTHILALTRFPPAVRALYILSLNESLAPEEMRALSETMYWLALDVCHPLATKGDQKRTFEGSRLLFGTLIERSKGPFVLSNWETKVSSTHLFQVVSLACGLSGEPLRDPVLIKDVVVDRGSAIIRQEGGALFDPTADPIDIASAPENLLPLIKRTALRTSRLVVLSDGFEIPPILVHKLIPSTLAVVINQANVELQIYAPLSLRDNVVTPALTLDDVGFNTVYISRGRPCSNDDDAFFLRPCHGGEVGVDVNTVAVRLEPIIKARKDADDWDIDAFGGARADRVDTREVEEAVVIALDLSRSMGNDFDPSERIDPEDEEDPDERAQNQAKERFFVRRKNIGDALPEVKEFIQGLDIIPSVHRFIMHGEDRANVWNGALIDEYSPRCHERAGLIIDELVIIFARAHWQASQDGTFAGTRLRDWEDFITAASDPTYEDRVISYLLDRVSQFQSEDAPNPWASPVPEKFLDPFSGKIFVDPVKASDGRTYERANIVAWCRIHTTSPMNPLLEMKSSQRLIPNRDLNGTILRFLNGRPRTALPVSQRCYLVSMSSIVGPSHQYLTLPGTETALSILIDEWVFLGRKPAATRLWSDLSDMGDGQMRGYIVSPTSRLDDASFTQTTTGQASTRTLNLSLRAWYYMSTGAERARLDSRLDIVKQAFEAFVNKLEAFDYPIALGLVTFGREVSEVQGLTLLKENFRSAVRSVTPDGDTPLYDSLSVAHSMLQAFKSQNPASALRVICLTDGIDVGSKILPHTVAAKMQKSKVVVDSIIVQTGGAQNTLHGISVATGGYTFQVETLENALNIVELETVLRSKDRVPRPMKPLIHSAWELTPYTSPWAHPIDEVTAESCPARKPHARIHESLTSAQKVAARSVPALSSDRQKRLMQEVREIVNTPHPAIDAYVGDDLAFWKIVIEAPKESPYAGGTFLAYVDFGEKYPQAAPEVRFITPILHPNINRHGKVCHAALDRSWLVDMTMSVIFQVLYGILLTPDVDNPLDLHATMEYNDDTGQHALKVHDMVVKFASKDRAAWRKELEEA